MKKSIVILLSMILFSNVFGQTNTYPFEVKKTGQGNRSIIFIPGFACSGEVWNETISKFENEYNCYALTMAGFAGVPAQPESTFNHWKTAIANYIKDNALDKPILVGHSMGGALALAVAADHPDLLDRIVVVDALPCLQALSNPSFTPQKAHDCT